MAKRTTVLLVVVAMVMAMVSATSGATEARATRCFGRTPTIWGTNGSETIWGTNGPDVIWAGGGNDTIYGYDGDDRICGKGGNDTIYGGFGDDRINGNGGSDDLYGESGDDLLKGGSGADYLSGTPGFDWDKAGRGYDTCDANDDIWQSCETFGGGVVPPPPPTGGGTLDWSLTAGQNGSLMSGFVPDPAWWNITSGGSIATSYLGTNCAGYAAAAPDFEFSWSGGGTMLRFYWIANAFDDAVLIINDPNGGWYCNDDWANYTYDPGITFNFPSNGTYDVWVASRYQGDFDPGRLYITEVGGNHP